MPFKNKAQMQAMILSRQPEDAGSSEEVVEEVRDAEQNEEEPVQNEEQPVLEEITEEEVQEQTEEAYKMM